MNANKKNTIPNNHRSMLRTQTKQTLDAKHSKIQITKQV